MTLWISSSLRRRARCVLAAAGALALAACAAVPPLPSSSERGFDFQRDSFAFANELIWQYPDAVRAAPGIPPSTVLRTRDYKHRCYSVAHDARLFYLHARFEPRQPPADDATYRRLVREVLSRSDDDRDVDADRVVIPGFADLHQFSGAREALLKPEMGGQAASYFQLGNWRMVFPFSGSHQQETAEQLLAKVRAQRPPVVHVIRFPVISINHFVLFYDAVESAADIRFTAYDPNNPDAPITLVFDRASRTFVFPPTDYFRGGPVSVYELARYGL